MDWKNEPWIKLYVRDTVNWQRWSWQVRTVFLHLLRKVDRRGGIDIQDCDIVEAISLVTALPEELVSTAIEDLMHPRRGAMCLTGERIEIPNFVEAQQTPSSALRRKREQRERERALGPVETREQNLPSSGSRCKKQGAGDNNEVLETQEGHAVSRDVTQGHQEKRSEENRTETHTKTKEHSSVTARDDKFQNSWVADIWESFEQNRVREIGGRVRVLSKARCQQILELRGHIEEIGPSDQGTRFTEPSLEVFRAYLKWRIEDAKENSTSRKFITLDAPWRPTGFDYWWKNRDKLEAQASGQGKAKVIYDGRGQVRKVAS